MMAAGWSGLGGGGRLALRIGVLVLALAAVGLPVNNLFKYTLLLALGACVLVGSIERRSPRWIAAAALAALVAAAHMIWPAPRIEQGFNVFLPGPALAQSSGLPADVLRVLGEQFNVRYPPEKGCTERSRPCWRPQRMPAADGYAFSADGIYDRPAFSRRVAGIEFSDPVELRLGIVNEYIYNWPDDASDVVRFTRDRKSLNLFDRFRVTFPLFIVHRFPVQFAGSDLCWRGTLMWEGPGGHFETITHQDMACRTLRAEDAQRRIYAASILPEPKLAMSLRPTLRVQIQRAVELGLSLLAVVGIGLLLVRIEPQRLILPAVVIGATVLLVTIVDWQFIGGYRPLDGGDDGITHEGLGRNVVRYLLAGDVVSALRGDEAIYYFAPALRYWRALERFIFGDTFLGYFTLILVLPFLVLALARRFMPPRWAIAFALIFVAVPIGTAFGSSLIDYVVWASRGFADPLGFILMFAGLVLIIPSAAKTPAPETGRAFAGALLLAMATFCRPNFLLATTTMAAAAIVAALARRQVARGVAIVAGFATLAVSPVHNYIFGRSFIPFTNNVAHVDIFLMSPLDYLRALGELVRLDFAGEHVRRGIVQLASWLSGAHHVMATIPIHLFAVLILARVLLLRGFDPWLRVLAFATLLQHGVAACYLNNARYHLGTWLLTALVATAWLQAEGLPWIRRRWPSLEARFARLPGAGTLASGLAGLERASAASPPALAKA